MINENTPTIMTRRLILRQFEAGDAPALFDILSDKEVNTFLPWFPLENMEQARSFLAKNFLDDYGKPSAYRYAVCRKADNRPIGYICLSDAESNDLGYGLKKEFWHKGLISEGAKAVTERIKTAGYPYITATHDVNNPHSGGVMKKIGMAYQYSYVEQWQPKDFPVTFRMYQLNFDGSRQRVFWKYWEKYENHFIEEGL
ncbi:MAG: GNAT family N-acetyltransferase [Eubacteriales bacterium]|nr:GNAT family N-acetyltransferase [Eubacteriales bacterium]